MHLRLAVGDGFVLELDSKIGRQIESVVLPRRFGLRIRVYGGFLPGGTYRRAARTGHCPSASIRNVLHLLRVLLRSEELGYNEQG